MKSLHAPWRDTYINDVQKKSDKDAENICVFCEHLAHGNDDQAMILGKFKYNFVIMNKFPYNAGHLLVMPLTHVATLQELSSDARAELIELIAKSDALLEQVLGNEGSNIGINKGRAGGAGIPSHLHVHVVPRWAGDTNFLPIIADVKQISTDMQSIFKKLKAEFAKLK